MSLTIALKPKISEKAQAATLLRTYVFDIPVGSNKQTIAEAITAQFKVGVQSVNIVNIKGKAKRSYTRRTRVAGQRPAIRKAYVTLCPGETIKLSVFEAAATSTEETAV